MNTEGVILRLVNRFRVNATKLHVFETEYISECLKKALASGRLSEADAIVARQWIDPNYVPVTKKSHTLVRF